MKKWLPPVAAEINWSWVFKAVLLTVLGFSLLQLQFDLVVLLLHAAQIPSTSCAQSLQLPLQPLQTISLAIRAPDFCLQLLRAAEVISCRENQTEAEY